MKKDGSMAVGAVGFVNDTLVRRVYVKERENAIINRLMKVGFAFSRTLDSFSEIYILQLRRPKLSVKWTTKQRE